MAKHFPLRSGDKGTFQARNKRQTLTFRSPSEFLGRATREKYLSTCAVTKSERLLIYNAELEEH